MRKILGYIVIDGKDKIHFKDLESAVIFYDNNSCDELHEVTVIKCKAG